MSPELYHALLVSTWQTVYMIIVSGALSVLIGIPLGVLLLTTRRDGLLEQIALNKALSFVVNVMRSVPFIILLVALVPLTRHLVGTSIGTTAAIVPLTLAAIPFVGRLLKTY